MDIKKIEKGIELVLDGLEVNRNDQHLKDTPKRVAKAYCEIFEGLWKEPPNLKVFRQDGIDQMIISDNIPFYSVCSHHLAIFRGHAKIAYIPQNGIIVGISKISRVLDYFAKRPSVQEIITNQVADYLYNSKELKPLGVGVILKASHDCEIIRGVKKEGSIMTTSALRGNFIETPTREEFLKL